MKPILFFLFAVFLLFHTHSGFAQGADCSQAEPFCTQQGAAFPASTNTIASVGPHYGCLGSVPNPAWYFLKIGTSGNINIALTNSNIVDVDFICWGPFNTLEQACPGIAVGPANLNCPASDNITVTPDAPLNSGPYTYPCGNIVDCSFDPQAFEEVNIPGAVAGQFYMLLITNYSGDPTDIFANQISGNGATDCSILTPCNIMDLSLNVSTCNGANTYTASGSFQYHDNPGTGSLIVEINNGTTTFTQTFNPPFTDSIFQNFSIPGIPGDGAVSNITVRFSDDPTCITTFEYDAPDCGCKANIGTFTITKNGQNQNNNPVVLCFGDTFSAVPNGTMIAPQEVLNPVGSAYNPGIGWLVYSCLPSVGLTPDSTQNLVNDPCLVSKTNGQLDFIRFNNLSEMNDQSWIINHPGVFTNNTVFFVPVTVYNMSDSVLSHSETAVPCYDLGTPIAVQFLPEVPEPSFSADTTLGCAPLKVMFTQQSNETNCVWNFGNGTTSTNCGQVSHTFNQGICFDISLTVKDQSGMCERTLTKTDLVCVHPIPVASFTPSPSIITTDELVSQMVNHSVNATTFRWDFGDSTQSSEVIPKHTFPDDREGSYIIELVVISDDGCSDTTHATVTISMDPAFYVPNAFTPDGDEFNQQFTPVFSRKINQQNYHLTIFNRWGEVMFESNNPEVGWDGTYRGKLAKEGIYSWKMEFQPVGNTKRQSVLGHVTLLR